MLGVGRTKLYELISTGALLSIRIGASRRIPRTAVETFVATLNGSPACDDPATPKTHHTAAVAEPDDYPDQIGW